MKKNFLLIFALLMLSALGSLKAQQRLIRGKVVDSSGESIPGVSIVVKGSSNGTITDINGDYQLSIGGGEKTLVFSFIGFNTREVKVGIDRVINITMKESVQDIDEVVVVGYGTMKKSDLSGAVAQIKSEDLVKGNPSDLSQGLAGKIAGVVVNQSDGAPGGGMSIQIRGTNSFSTNTQPLYIVDGVPFDVSSTPTSDANDGSNSSNPLSFINPHDIESVEVLKDASATAIYGSRGANGVVIITTKRGTEGKENVEFSATYSTSRISKKVEVLDAYTYAKYRNEQYINGYKYNGLEYTNLPFSGKWSYTTVNGAADYSNGTYTPSPEDFLEPGVYTDEYGNEHSVGRANWLDEITQDGLSQEYNLSISGASKKGWHSYSGNYLNQTGIIKGSGFERLALRVGIGRKVTDFLEMGMSMNFSHSNKDFSSTNNYNSGIIRSALKFLPTFAPDDQTALNSDELNWLASNPYNYVRNATDEMKSISIFNSSYLELKLLPFLKFRQNIGVRYSGRDRGTYYGYLTSQGSSSSNINGKAGQSSNWGTGTTFESLLKVNKKINKIHSVNAVVGFTAEQSDYGNKSMSATGFPSDLTKYYDMSLATNPGTLVSGRGSSSLSSFLGRVNYTLKDKYILTASYRADGSSKFTDKNKWASFLSGAFAWRISEEQFVKNLKIFSNLKLRLSYGETGNQGIGSYRTLPMLSSAKYPFNGSITNGFAEVSWRGPVADDLRWETTSQYNLGLDIGVLDSRLNVTVDYYYKKTYDLLQSILIPSSTGFSSMLINSGNVTNEGLEIAGKYFVLQGKSLKWSIDANIAFNRNKIGGLESDQFASRLWYGADDVFLQRNGLPIGTIYGYVEDGFYDNIAEVMASPDASIRAKGEKMIGEIKYRNFDDDPALTEADRQVIGNTNPDFVYGITNNIEYKNFSLSFFLQGSQGNDIFNGNYVDVDIANAGNIPLDAYKSRWTEENAAQAKWPKAINSYERTILISDRFVEDGSYIKLKNVSIGYKWKPNSQIIKLINIYANASNLFTITDYSWFDPEVNAFGTDASRKGIDIYSYPSSRTFSVGIKASF